MRVFLASLLAITAVSGRAMTLGAVRDDGTRPDDFTKLVIDTRRPGSGKDDASTISDAVQRMKEMHCAMRGIAEMLERREVKGIAFGSIHDDNGQYDSSTKVITINKERAYLRDPMNLAKGLYHEGLHHVEFSLGLRGLGESSSYHDSRRIPLILRTLLGPNAPCLKLVGPDGRLFTADGSPYDPAYAAGSPSTDSTRPDPNETGHHLDSNLKWLNRPVPTNFDQDKSGVKHN